MHRACQHHIPWVIKRLLDGRPEIGEVSTEEERKLVLEMNRATPQDVHALEAFAHLLDAYAISDGEGRRATVAAMKALLDGGFQKKLLGVAKRMIPAALDWGIEDELWEKIKP